MMRWPRKQRLHVCIATEYNGVIERMDLGAQRHLFMAITDFPGL